MVHDMNMLMLGTVGSPMHNIEWVMIDQFCFNLIGPYVLISLFVRLGHIVSCPPLKWDWAYNILILFTL